MNRARLGLMAIAIVAAAGAAFLVRTMATGRSATPDPAAQAEAIPETEVLVAARAIEPGTILAAVDLKWQPWPQKGVTASYITRATAPDAAKDNVGAMVRFALEAGEPVTRSKVVHAGDAGFMAAMLTPGMRAISIRISEESGAGGFILPNDRVDVIMTRKRKDESVAQTGDHETQTILRNVRVLAIGQTFAGGDDERIVQGKTATLELTPSHAELLALAGAMGDLTLALRSVAQGDITGAAAREDDWLGRPAEDGSIRVVRYARPARVVPMSGHTKAAKDE